MGLFDRLQTEIQAREQAAGLSIADILALPAAQRTLVLWLIGQERATLTEVATHLGASEATARASMSPLVAQSFVREMTIDGVVNYQIRFARRRGRQVPLNLWQALYSRLA